MLVPTKQSGLVPSKQINLVPGKQLVQAAAAKILWTPLQLGSKLIAWWDPNQGVATDGNGNVNSWTDRVGGLVATAQSGQQPGLGTRNGVPRLLFNGGQAVRMSAQTLPMGTTPTTLCMSAYCANSDNSQPFIGGWGNSSGGARATYQLPNGNVGTASGGFDLDTGISYINQDRFTITLFDVHQVSARVDGAAAGSVAHDLVADNNYGYSAIGFWPTYGPPWRGDIGHVLAITPVLSLADCLCLEGWESWADGKAGSNLPSNHPYASAPPYVITNVSTAAYSVDLSNPSTSAPATTLLV